MKLLKRAMPIPPYTLTKERETLDDGNNTSHPLAFVDDSTMLAGESTCVSIIYRICTASKLTQTAYSRVGRSHL